MTRRRARYERFATTPGVFDRTGRRGNGTVSSACPSLTRRRRGGQTPSDEWRLRERLPRRNAVSRRAAGRYRCARLRLRRRWRRRPRVTTAACGRVPTWRRAYYYTTATRGDPLRYDRGGGTTLPRPVPREGPEAAAAAEGSRGERLYVWRAYVRTYIVCCCLLVERPRRPARGAQCHWHTCDWPTGRARSPSRGGVYSIVCGSRRPPR